MIREAFQDLNRLREIAMVVARHGFGAYLDRTRIWDIIGRRDAAMMTPAPERGRQTAARFRQLLTDLGPTFIKFGQVLSSRPDMLPATWIEELTHLQDSVAPFSMAEVRLQIEKSFEKTLEELFADFEEKPLASASIGQVHRARTHDGRLVAVKVQRPRIRDRMESDVGLLYYLARLLEAVIEETGIYTPTGIIEEFDKALADELDYQNEARNVREMKAKSLGRDFLVIPAVIDELSSPTVLTLEFIEGKKMSEILADPTGYDSEKIARNIIEASFHQLFDDGIFHGDPHPGNLLVLPGNRLGLLDMGLVGRLTKPMQDSLVMLIMAIALKDPDTIARLLYKVGVPEAGAPLTQFRGDIKIILDRYAGLKLDEIKPAALLPDLLELAVKHKIRIPKEYAILSKASLTVEGMIRKLHPGLDIAAVGMPYARELLSQRFNPADAGGTMMKSLLRLQALTEDLPAQLSQILMDLEAGKFRVNIQSAQLDRISDNIRGLGMTVFSGLLASGLTIGGFFLLSRYSLEWRGVPILAIVALLSASGFFGAAVTWYVVKGRLRKISVKRFLRK